MADEQFSPVAILGITLGATLIFAFLLLVVFVCLYKRKTQRNSAVLEQPYSHRRKKSRKQPVRDIVFRRSDESGDRPVSNESKQSFYINPALLTSHIDAGRDSYTRPAIIDNTDVPKRQSLERSDQGHSARYSSDPAGGQLRTISAGYSIVREGDAPRTIDAGYSFVREGDAPRTIDAGYKMVSMIGGDNYIYSKPIKLQSFDTPDRYDSQTRLVPEDHRYTTRAPAPDPTQQRTSRSVHTTDPESHYQSVYLEEDPTARPGPISTVIQPGSSASLDRKAWMTSSQGGYRGSIIQ